MIPSVGRIVHYKLGNYEVENEINERMSSINRHEVGQIVPMLIVKVHAPDGQANEQTSVNGRAFLDGDHDLWVTSRQQGDGLSQWSDPVANAAAFGPGATPTGTLTVDTGLRDEVSALDKRVTVLESLPEASQAIADTPTPAEAAPAEEAAETPAEEAAEPAEATPAAAPADAPAEATSAPATGSAAAPAA